MAQPNPSEDPQFQEAVRREVARHLEELRGKDLIRYEGPSEAAESIPAEVPAPKKWKRKKSPKLSKLNRKLWDGSVRLLAAIGLASITAFFAGLAEAALTIGVGVFLVLLGALCVLGIVLIWHTDPEGHDG